MARSVQEIKKQMTDAFMADELIREKYQLQEGDTFDARFSLVSLENILFFIVASAHYVLERIFEQFKLDVDRRIASSVVATIPWYHKQALAFQYGDSLTLDSDSLRWQYPKVDESKRLVRFASVKDLGGSIQILVSKDFKGVPQPLTDDELRAFKSYMHAIKIAGVVLSIRSLPADVLHIQAKVQLDPLVFLPSGERIRDGKKPIEEAIHAYLAGITYGGVFNKTKLVDALQAVEGVVDIELGDITASPHFGSQRKVQGNNYSARSGCFTSPDFSGINYHY